MRIENITKDSVSLILTPQKAARLLTGLQEHREQCGEFGRSLAAALEGAGVHPEPHPAVRYEYDGR